MADYKEEAIGKEKVFDFVQQLMDDMKNGNFEDGLIFVSKKINDGKGHFAIQVQSVNNVGKDKDVAVAMYGSIVKSCFEIIEKKGLAEHLQKTMQLGDNNGR